MFLKCCSQTETNVSGNYEASRLERYPQNKRSEKGEWRVSGKTTKTALLCVAAVVFCTLGRHVSAGELRFGLTTDNRMCYITQSGDALEVLQNFDGRLSFVGKIKNGMRCLLRHAKTMPNGTIQVGEIVVTPGEDQAESQVKLFIIEDISAKFITGRIENVGISTLAKMSCPIEGHQYAITESNELVLVHLMGPFVQVVHPLGAEPAMNDDLTTDDFMNGKFAMMSVQKLPDGRIRLPDKLLPNRPSQKEESGEGQKPSATRPPHNPVKPKPRTIIPSKGSGVWVTVIGRYGQAQDSDITVYVLTDKEIALYDKKELPLRPAGKAPLMLRHLKPGRYYVGIQQQLDPSFIRPKLFRRPALLGVPPAATSTRVKDPLSAYLNDLPARRAVEIRVVRDRDGKAIAAYYQMKWYVVEVSESHIVPVVCLLVKNGTLLEELEGENPREEQFDISASEELMRTFWHGIAQFGPELTHTQRESIVQLLRRGGKVCLPGTQTPSVVSVGPVGKPRAQFALNKAEPLVQSDLVTLNEPVVATHPAKSKEPNSLLPPFEEPLTGANEVRIINPNSFAVTVGLRMGRKGANLNISPESTSSVFVPDGSAEVYFIYSNKPKTLYQGDDLGLHGHGVRIQLVTVVGGNYSIRRATQ